MKNKRFAVLVNLNAHQGEASKTWSRIRKEVFQHLPQDTIEFTFSPPCNYEEIVSDLLINHDINCFISAGGDGSVNYLLNALLKLKNKIPGIVSIGGIGLGSSNDFLKPYGKMLAGVPVRMDIENTTPCDVGKVSFSGKEAIIQQRYFIANASLGLTARANYNFNHPGPFLKVLKKYWTKGAIIWTALSTLLFHKNMTAILHLNGKESHIRLSNLAVLKNPNVSGDFRYDLEIKPDEGRMGLCYCENMNRLELLKTLFDLSEGRFSGKPKRHSIMVKQFRIKTDNPEPLETDGEIMLASDMVFDLIPSAINLLGVGVASNLKTKNPELLATVV